MSSQAGKFRAENWAVPSVSWHGTLLLAWDTTGKEGFLLSVGERPQCSGPRAAAVILLMAQVTSTDTQRCPVPILVEWSHLLAHTSPTTALGCAAVRCLLFLRLVSALCHIHVGDGDSFAGHLMAQSAPLKIAFSLISNLNSPCSILIPLLLLC